MGVTQVVGRLVKLRTNGGLLADGTGALFHRGLELAAATSLVNDGDQYYDTTLSLPVWQQNGLAVNQSGKLYVNTADSNTISNATSGTFTGTTFTLPANYFSVGKVLEFFINADISCTAGVSALLNVNVGATAVASLVNFTPAVNLSGNRIYGGITLTCRTTGTTGSFGRSGMGITETANPSNVSSAIVLPGGTGVTINTTVSNAITLSVGFGSASVSNSMFIHQLIVKAIN